MRWAADSRPSLRCSTWLAILDEPGSPVQMLVDVTRRSATVKTEDLVPATMDCSFRLRGVDERSYSGHVTWGEMVHVSENNYVRWSDYMDG